MKKIGLHRANLSLQIIFTTMILAIFFAGCGTAGKNFDESLYAKIIKGTTFEEIQANTDANTKKITDAFTDTAGNFEKMKTNNTNIRPFNKG